MFSFKFNGKVLDLSKPKVMGILNATPDSFYDGGRYSGLAQVESRVEEMIYQGVDIIDIGGMSSRPGAKIISVEEENDRVLPVLKIIRKKHSDIFVSIDTFRAEVAKNCIEEGADIINDISAAELDENITEVVAHYDVPYVFMHMKGIPENMQNNPQYDNVTSEVLKYMFNRVRFLRSKGVNKLIADPGFGFGKTLSDNYELLKNMGVFKILEIPILVGLSRKSMLYKLLDTNPENSLNATTAMNAIAINNGANIIRVHDVKEGVEVVKLMNMLKS